jgi:hypothetical protein
MPEMKEPSLAREIGRKAWSLTKFLVPVAVFTELLLGAQEPSHHRRVDLVRSVGGGHRHVCGVAELQMEKERLGKASGAGSARANGQECR